MKKIILHTFILGIISFFAACNSFNDSILNDINQPNPSTITLDATNITDCSAVVSGKINVEYWEYVTGNSNNYCGVFYSQYESALIVDVPHSLSGCEEIKANDIAEEFSVTLWGLEETETYYYRAFVCVNDVLYRFGEIKSFTTLETPEPEKPEIKLGVFSVGSGNYINFSPGNLQYHARNNRWRFAPEQYEYIGDRNKNISSSYNGWIDLFGWGTGNNPTRYSTNESSYKTFIDWGGNMIWDGNLLYEAGTWRTLTTSEWEYLLSKRSNASSLIGIAQVAGTNGLILLPDDWECPDGITFNSGFGSSYSSVNTYNASKWAILEAAGAIFLPAGGHRSTSAVYDVQQFGNYWTATYDGFSKDGEYYNYYMDFSLSKSSVKQSGMKLYCGASVRLVKSL